MRKGFYPVLVILGFLAIAWANEPFSELFSDFQDEGIDAVLWTRGSDESPEAEAPKLGASAEPAPAVKPAVTQPQAAPSFGEQEAMHLVALREAAFARCQEPFAAPTTEPVPVLDPPNGGPEAVGMVYQEELAVRSRNLLDRDEFYVNPRPRAAVNTLPMEIFVDPDGAGIYRRKTWEDADPDYSSPSIQPAIDKSAIPAAGRVLTELIIGHRSPKGDYPQLFDIRSSAYVRFAGYPPQVTGASLRLGAHRIFGMDAQGEGAAEDFPVVRAAFVSVRDRDTAHAYLLVESRLFCAALSVDMSPRADTAEMVVDSYWYAREDFRWKEDPHTAFVAYSSMLWKSEKHTPWWGSDEAHDSDSLTVKRSDGSVERIAVDPPESGLRARDLTESGGASVSSWTLANEDRDPAHYADFKPALGDTNYDLRASYDVQILEASVRTGVSFYEHSPDGEYGDNLVAASTIRQDIPKATDPSQYVRFKYRTTAFFP
jgi:hypothetical protein